MMQDDTQEGYEEVQALLRNAAKMVCGLSNHDLGHAVIDLCRTVRKEIDVLGLKGNARSLPLKSYEGILLWRLMPEMARRLIKEGGAELLLLPGERPVADVTNTSAEKLRQIVGLSLTKGAFDVISEKIRDQFDPYYKNRNTFYASEVVGQDIRSGNVVEIALHRLAPAPSIPPASDYIATRIHAWAERHGKVRDHATWFPDLPEYHRDMDETFELPEEKQETGTSPF